MSGPLSATTPVFDPLTAELAQVEQAQVHALLPPGLQGTVVQVPGYWPLLNLDVRGDRAWSLMLAGPNAPMLAPGLRGDLAAWPIASDCAAVVILLHILEQVDDPAPLLAEAERVLMPSGRLLIAGFNPWSLCGLRGLAERFGSQSRHWWPQHLRSVSELRQQLSRLPMQVEEVTTAFFRPPVARHWVLNRTGVMERLGPRLLPRAGGVYCLAASKRRLATPALRLMWQQPSVYGRRPLREPSWRVAA